MVNYSLEEMSQFKIFYLLSLTNHLQFFSKKKEDSWEKKRKEKVEKEQTWK